MKTVAFFGSGLKTARCFPAHLLLKQPPFSRRFSSLFLGVIFISLFIAGSDVNSVSAQEPPTEAQEETAPVAQKPAEKTVIKIDAKTIGAPISKFIYGQFIEHLGRCIYGGIWAEMLEDRKFYYAIGTKGSPWKVVGKKDAVQMSDEKPFVGEHTPVITLSGGDASVSLEQEKLALKKGMRYCGYIWLSGDASVAPVRVTLRWGSEPKQSQTVTIGRITSPYVKYPFEFLAQADSNDGTLSISPSGTGTVKIGTVSLMPGDNVEGMRADTLALLKELDAPVYRWPGGNFVSGYNWKDGIGDRDRRPPRKNPAWRGVEHNDFGMDEFMVFCRELNTEPYIAVNSGLGDAQTAVEELQYANGESDTPMGKLRAENGHPDPYNVVWWSIGNEMYGDWQLGNMPISEYVKKHNQFAEAMKKECPTIKLIGVGNVPDWSEEMLTHCTNNMDLISEHFYCQERPNNVAWHVQWVAEHIKRITDTHREFQKTLPELKNKKIPIAMDEWNYWYGPHVFGELGTRYFLKDGLGIAMGLNEYYRQSDMVFMANYAQTVNVIGAIKTNKREAWLETTGLVLKMYRHHFGQLPLKTETEKPYDAVAAFSEDKTEFTLSVVNPMANPLDLTLDMKGVKTAEEGKSWYITGKPEDFNDPEKTIAVELREKPAANPAKGLRVEPYSATIFVWDVQ